MKNFIILRKKFQEIKNLGLIVPLRKGTTGIGYTFETLIGKHEDSKSKPDYLGIEIKTKFGYSKCPITLFNCIPKRNNISAIQYIFNKYAYKKYNDKNTFIFCRNIFCSNSKKIFNYSFKLYTDYEMSKIILKSYLNDIFIEDVCYWNFNDLENKLKHKLKYLAIIYAYPYKINNAIYYKYLKMNTYKFKNFEQFLKLINEDKVFVEIFLKGEKNFIKENHGIAFRIKNEFIDELFTKLKY